MEQKTAESIWIQRVPRAEALARAAELERQSGALHELPLFGVPFAVKDNIDVAGFGTTAALPEPIYVAERTAPVVERLLDAGALLIGKTNLDQLACGLVGTRSPYGVVHNPFNSAYIAGGSSSGSAVAVSAGLVSFALGTDTAGSGRVPAAFNNLVGIKPSRGIMSTRGVVPACRSLDCVSIFALDVADAVRVADVARGFDEADPRSRRDAAQIAFSGASVATRVRLGIPRADQLEFFGDAEARAAFERALERFGAHGAQLVPIDFAPFSETAALLYGGPWIAERATLLDELPKEPRLLPIIRDIFADAARYDARATFKALHHLAELSRRVDGYWANIDALLVPSTPTIYTVAQVLAEPRELNARLGIYTNFVNLLELAAIAVPNGFRADGLPTGITLIGPRDSDARLAALGAGHEAALARERGPKPAELVQIAVVGAHLSGQPLNSQLTTLGARLVRACRTTPKYRLYALSNTTPRKPGLVHDETSAGPGIEVEVWELSKAALGAFMSYVAPPLCIGTLHLEDGSACLGFLCESYAVRSAEDISHFGGWRAYLKQQR